MLEKELSKKASVALVLGMSAAGLIALAVAYVASEDAYSPTSPWYGKATPLDLFALACLGIVAIMCLSYAAWSFLSWALARGAR